MSGETEQSDFAGLVAMATVAALDGCPWVEKGHLWELSSTVAALAAERASEVDSLLLPNETLFEKQELSEKYRYRSNLLSAYAVIAGLQNQVEDDERNMRAARRQIELFMEDGKRECLTVALALLDASVEARNEAWFDFTEQRGQ